MDSSIKMNGTISPGLRITASVWDGPERSGFAPSLRGIQGVGSVAANLCGARSYSFSGLACTLSRGGASSCSSRPLYPWRGLTGHFKNHCPFISIIDNRVVKCIRTLCVSVFSLYKRLIRVYNHQGTNITPCI